MFVVYVCGLVFVKWGLCATCRCVGSCEGAVCVAAIVSSWHVYLVSQKTVPVCVCRLDLTKYPCGDLFKGKDKINIYML